MKKYLKIIVTILSIIVLISVIAYVYFGYSPKPALPEISKNIRSDTIKVGDLTRDYLFYIPKDLPTNAPLVIVLHASSQDAQAMRISTAYEFERLAEAEKFVVIYPNGYRNNWNDCRKTASYPARIMNIDDKSFISQLIDKFNESYKIDSKRVFATGYSNGGHLAYRLALEMPNKITAIAAIAASLPTPSNNDCQESKKFVPAMVINGTADPINPYNGGKVTLFGFGNRGTVLSSVDSIKYFAQLDKEIGEPVISILYSEAGSSIEKYEYQSNNLTKAVLYKVENGGHVVLQPFYSFPRILGQTNHNINVPVEIWTFFAQQPSLNKWFLLGNYKNFIIS